MSSDKIKVVQHSKYIGYSGTDRTAQLFYKHLNERDDVECYLVYREGVHDSRRKYVEEWFGSDKVIPYKWEPRRKSTPPYLPNNDNLFEVLNDINPDIFHIHRGGWNEWPGMRYIAPNAKIVETNIFGHADPTAHQNIDHHIYISEHIRNLAIKNGGPDGSVLYNPIEMPHEATEDFANRSRRALIDRFNLPENAVILGRIGRPDNFDPISLNALKRITNRVPHAHYIVVNPCQSWYDKVSSLGLKDKVHFIDEIIDDVEISKFYAGLDIYAHARHDGECCPCNIQEAMMHGVLVISHVSKLYNGQQEIIADCGFVAGLDDDEMYANLLFDAIVDETGRNITAYAGRRRAMGLFEASCITSRLVDIYKEVLS